MANTLIPIQTYTLTGTTASVTFSNIPQSYTDLKIVASVRGTRALTYDGMSISFNGTATNSNWSTRVAYGTGSGTPAGSSGTDSGIAWIVAANAVAGIYGSVEYYIPNYTSGNNKIISVDSVTEDNAGLSITQIAGGVWTVTSAITSITLAPSVNLFASGSTFTLYGISNGVKATGGTVVCAGGYAYHTFTSTGSFLPNQQIKGAEVLVIAGGGGAAGGDGNGGAGAGGLLYSYSQTLLAGNTYTALVGSGGTAPAVNTATKGSDSVFGSLVAKGGGASPPNSVGSNNTDGGSGAGGTYSQGYASYYAGIGTIGQGNNGGYGAFPGSNYSIGGGGGGAGSVGGAATTTVAGSGGNGLSSYSAWGLATSTGQNVGGTVYYAGGGGGGTDYRVSGNTNGSGGNGGGGAGGSSGGAGTAGTANTGGGGGGGGYNGSFNKGGTGGSGLIIVRYPLA